MTDKAVEQSEQGVRKNGGARPNSGPKKGAVYAKTLEKRAAIEEFRKRVRKNLDKIYNSQLNLALGRTYVYEIVETGSGKDKKREHVLVTDPDEIREVLDNGSGTLDDSYYYITTKDPDNKAIDSLLDRAFGKAQQSLDHTTGGESINKILVEFIDGKPKDNSDSSRV